MENTELKELFTSWSMTADCASGPDEKVLSFGSFQDMLKSGDLAQFAPPKKCENAKLLIDAIVNLLNEDGHCFGSRPCATCKAVSGMIGRPFGCYEYQRKRGLS